MDGSGAGCGFPRLLDDERSTVPKAEPKDGFKVDSDFSGFLGIDERPIDPQPEPKDDFKVDSDFSGLFGIDELPIFSQSRQDQA